MKGKRGLGKGLQALIPEEINTPHEGIARVSIDEIYPNKNQPRIHFDKEKLEELSASIKEHGVIQPIVLVKEEKGYKIIAGERRWRAAKMAGLKEIPAVLMTVTEKQVMELALIENLQREDLNEIEAATAYKELMERFQLTQQEIAQRIGKSRASIANTLRLLNLPENMQALIRSNDLSPGHGRCLLSLDGEKQEVLLQRIRKEQLSVREAEKLAQSMKKEKKIQLPKENPRQLDHIFLQDLEERLQQSLGTKVAITEKNKKGKIEIEFYNMDDLDRLVERLSSPECFT